MEDAIAILPSYAAYTSPHSRLILVVLYNIAASLSVRANDSGRDPPLETAFERLVL